MEVGLTYGILIRGDSFDQKFVFKADGVAMNITGSTVKFSIKRNISDVSYIVSQDATLTAPIIGECSVSIPKETTATWDLGYYNYDVQLTDSNGKRYTPIIGKFELIYDITI